jgi:iron complex outermembrane receptor protein
MQPIDNLNVSLDYWNFDYTNLIAQSASAQSIVDRDCDDGVVNDPRIFRGANGQLREVVSDFINVGSVDTSGVDLVMVYDFDLAGSQFLSLDLRATWVGKFDVDDGSGAVIDGVGYRNFNNAFHTMTEWRGNAGLMWALNQHLVNLTARYIGGYDNDQSNGAPVSSMTTLDARYSISLDELLGSGQTTLAIGVNNLFDEAPPALRRNDSSGNLITRADDPISWIDRPSYDQLAGHDIRGRVVYLNLKHSF